MKYHLVFLLLSFSLNAEHYLDICGRDGLATYRINVPEGWHMENTPSHDTKQAICTFNVDTVRITIHTFPDPIPPAAQINRWKQQFETLEPQSVSVQPQAFSGYVGWLFEGTGMFEGKYTTVLAWSMQLAPEHDQMLQGSKRSDVTLKAMGPADTVARYRNALIAFARSFELIEEIPSR